MIQSIDRAAQILSSLSGARHLGITELASALGLPPSTVHGLVASLLSHGLVVKEPGTNRYMLGPALLKLSNVYLDTLDVRARAMRWTAELARRTEYATRLAVPLFDEVIVTHHNPRPGGFDQMPEIGVTIPIHASALGKVILAYDQSAADALLSRPLRSLTGATTTDPAQLAVELAHIVERGIAHEEDEAVLGESSIAAPIADRLGTVVAAVSVVLPSSEYPPGDNVLNDLRETARNISRELGAPTWPPTSARHPVEPDPRRRTKDDR